MIKQQEQENYLQLLGIFHSLRKQLGALRFQALVFLLRWFLLEDLRMHTIFEYFHKLKPIQKE